MNRKTGMGGSAFGGGGSQFGGGSAFGGVGGGGGGFGGAGQAKYVYFFRNIFASFWSPSR